MSIIWPATPALGAQVVGPHGEIWQWDGQKWIGAGGGGGGGGGLTDDAPDDGLLYGRRSGLWDQVPIPADIPEDTSIVPVGGRLRFISSSEIGYFPFNGGWMRINGQDYALPVTGICAGRTGVSIDGVPGQTLATGTRYYVYLFDDNGELKIDYSTIGHASSATPGNVGIEIKNGDDTRSLVGQITLVSNTFRDDAQVRYVRTWYNRKSLALIMTGNVSTAAGFWGVTAALSFLAFAGETVSLVATGTATALLAGASANFTIWYLGGPMVAATTSYMGTITVPVIAQIVVELSETSYSYAMAGTSATSSVTISCNLSATLLE